jgi:tetratricopeptide (TPR) repeat protein
MLLTARRIASTSSEVSDSVSEIAQAFSGFNRQTYLRLRLALGLGLRRQVFLSVCDDLPLRNQLCQWLVSDLSRDPLPELQQIAGDGASLNGVSRPELTSSNGIRLVTLTLKPEQPDLQKLIVDWLTHRRGRVSLSKIAFQIVGVENLTRQPAQVQRQFLNSLRSIGRYHDQLDLNLILWVNKPWFHSIRQSAPEFWRGQTGSFQFDGEVSSSEGLMARSALEIPFTSADFTQPTTTQDRTTTVPIADTTASPIASPTESPPIEQTIALNKLLRTWSPNLTDPTLTDRLQAIAAAEQDSPQEPEHLAQAYRNLGNWYRDTDRPDLQLLTLGIQAYGAAFTRTDFEDPVACDILNDLGNLYWMRSRHQETPDDLYNDLQSAIEHYQKAIFQTDEFQESARYAMLQNNLGATWGELSQQFDPEAHLPHAIAAYTASLRHRPLETFPQQHASTQNNLGTAYWTLAQYQDPLQNLLKAIECYDVALQHYTADEHAMPHAMIQNNLGTTYWNLSQCENLAQVTRETSQDLLIRAIESYQIALVHRTPEAAPSGYAATENNLGTAYWHLSNNDYTDPASVPDLLDLSITSYHNCLTMVEQLIQDDVPQFSFDPYSTHHNLGAAYYRAVTHGKSALTIDQQKESLNYALTHHIVAWQGWQDQPEYAGAAIDGMAQALRATQERFGTQLQAKLLSKIPPQILAQVMPQV